MDDKLIAVRMMSPHDHDFTHERPDGSTYKVMYRHHKEQVTEEIIDYQGTVSYTQLTLKTISSE